jgi:hypothetical protein
MLRRSIVPFILAATLLLTLAAPSAATAAHGAPPTAPGSLWSEAWAWVTGFFVPLGAETDRGCEIDPNGRCLPQILSGPHHPPTPDAGCSIDPNGRCLP